MNHEQKIKIMMDYLTLKIEERDWHGVADCAMDLRDIESEERGKIMERSNVSKKTKNKKP